MNVLNLTKSGNSRLHRRDVCTENFTGGMHDNGLRIVLPGEIDFSFFLYSFLFFFFFLVAGEFGVCTSGHDMHLIRGKPMKTKRCIANCQMKSASPAATITHTAMVVLSPSEK